jgi:hypothetical protein
LASSDGLFEEGQQVYLKDNLMGIEQELNAASYSFSSSAGVFNERFEIHYQSTLSAQTPQINANQVVIYTQNKNIAIQSSIDVEELAIFDITGRLIKNIKNVQKRSLLVPIEWPVQIMIIRLTLADGSIVTKKVGIFDGN